MISKYLKKALNMPMAQWDDYAKSAAEELQTACDEAAFTAVHLARFNAYMTKRRLGGSHDEAVRNQNDAALKARKALGFSYPKDEVNF